jgi:hypothetical protein
MHGMLRHPMLLLLLLIHFIHRLSRTLAVYVWINTFRDCKAI